MSLFLLSLASFLFSQSGSQSRSKIDLRKDPRYQTYHPQSNPNTVKTLKMFLTLHHPKKTHPEAWRLGNSSRPLSTPAGCTGFTEIDVARALREWQPDDMKYIKMDYALPESSKLWFIKSNENPDNFIPILIGKEYKSSYAKAAFQNVITGRIVFRSATFAEPIDVKRSRYHSLDTDWMVETGLFTADRSFWRKMRREFRDFHLED